MSVFNVCYVAGSTSCMMQKHISNVRFTCPSAHKNSTKTVSLETRVLLDPQNMSVPCQDTAALSPTALVDYRFRGLSQA